MYFLERKSVSFQKCSIIFLHRKALKTAHPPYLGKRLWRTLRADMSYNSWHSALYSILQTFPCVHFSLLAIWDAQISKVKDLLKSQSRHKKLAMGFLCADCPIGKKMHSFMPDLNWPASHLHTFCKKISCGWENIWRKVFCICYLNNFSLNFLQSILSSLAGLCSVLM
jgi:hypothetical protein